jgi:AraC family transcriptional activator of pobA
MKEKNYLSKQNSEKGILPVHSLDNDSSQINILPLDHNNPYDFKREHRHTYFEIMLIKKGGCNQLIDFKNYIGHDYSCYIICPQQIHLMNRNNSTGTVLQFTEDRISSTNLRSSLLELLYIENGAIVFENNPSLFNDFDLLLNILIKNVSKKYGPRNLVVTNLLQAFIALIVEQNNLNNTKVKSIEKKLLFDFYQLLDINYRNNRGVQFYVDKLVTTEKKLSSIIKKHTGLTPLQVIHNRILLEAKRLLLFEEITHKEISYQLGFDSPASFSTFIKSKTGYSPSELTQHLAEIHK